MKYTFICYPKCSTCMKAKKWLEEKKIDFEIRDITKQIPSVEELRKWIPQSNKEIKSFFNTSGLQYKNNHLKEKLPNMTEQEKLELLSSNGMLIKRPLLIGENKVLIGFKEKEWEENA